MSNKKQTAVEWLVEQIENKNGKEFTSYYLEFIEQAKRIERHCIIEAYLYGESNKFFRTEISAKQYYTSTYEK
jgi:hypothetical protein